MKIVDFVSFEKAFLSEPVGKLKLKESEYETSGSICVVDQGQKLISGYTSRADLIRENGPYIVFGDHTRVIKFIDFPFVVGADGVRLYKAAEGYDPEFLYFFLNSITLPIDGYGRHSKYLKEFTVQKFDKAVQCRIAARLKTQLAEVEKARRAVEVQLGSIADLIESGIETAINTAIAKGSESIQLGDVVSISAKLVNPTVPDFRELPHVSAENIVSITGEFVGLKSAAEDGMKSNKYLFEAGDVLYSKLRPYLRKVALPNFAGLCSADMYPLKVVPERIDAGFLKILLTSKLFTEYANEKSARSRMPKLNRDQLFSWEFKLPSLNDQKECFNKTKLILFQARVAYEAAMKMRDDLKIIPAKILSQTFEM